MVTTQLRRKFRNYTLMVATTAVLGMASTGCPACNFASPHYELFHMVVSLSSNLGQEVYLFGPGEFNGIDNVAAKLLKPFQSRTLDVGERNDGDTMTFSLFSKEGAFLRSVACRVKLSKYPLNTFENSTVVAFQFQGNVGIACHKDLQFVEGSQQ